MLTMIDKGEVREAHPAYWAPFVVVGRGGRREVVAILVRASDDALAFWAWGIAPKSRLGLGYCVEAWDVIGPL
jgi:hypothetical protein